MKPDARSERILEYRRNFVCQLTNARSLPEVCTFLFDVWKCYVLTVRQERNRPIVFLGHSLGEILILQVSDESTLKA